MDKDDREAQALDDFWGKMEKWRRSCFVSTNEAAALAIAYDVWMDLRDPPGDPHKEWVDAEKMKPNATWHPVLVRMTSGETGLGDWLIECKTWRVQLLMADWTSTKDGVTHWRYMPQDDDNG